MIEQLFVPAGNLVRASGARDNADGAKLCKRGSGLTGELRLPMSRVAEGWKLERQPGVAGDGGAANGGAPSERPFSENHSVPGGLRLDKRGRRWSRGKLWGMREAWVAASANGRRERPAGSFSGLRRGVFRIASGSFRDVDCSWPRGSGDVPCTGVGGRWLRR